MTPFRRVTFLILILMVWTGPGLTSCSSRSDQDELSRVKKETGEAVEAGGAYLDAQREAAVRKLRSAYNDVSERIRTFRDQYGDRLDQTQRELMSDLEDKQASIEKKLDEARTQSKETWKELESDISASMDDLENAFQDIRKNFQE